MRRFVLPVLAFALIASACSSEGEAEEVASLTASDQNERGVVAAESEIDREEAILAFTQCLRDEGLDVEDPEVGTDGELRPPRPASVAEGDRDALAAARDVCSEYLEGVTLGLEGRDTTEFSDMLLEYAACMRDNGYEMDDPDLTGFTPGSGQGGGPLSGIEDRDDPSFITADEVCRVIFTDAGFGGRGGGGGGGEG